MDLLKNHTSEVLLVKSLVSTFIVNKIRTNAKISRATDDEWINSKLFRSYRAHGLHSRSRITSHGLKQSLPINLPYTQIVIAIIL